MKMMYGKMEMAGLHEDVHALVQVLVILAYYAYNKDFAPKKVRNSFRPLLKEADSLFSEYNLPVFQYESIINEFMTTGLIDESYEYLEEVFSSVTFLQETMSQESTMSPMLLDILKNARFAAQGSATAYIDLARKVSAFKNKNIMTLFTANPETVKRQHDILESLESVVKQLGGKGYNLDLKQRKIAKKDDPELYQVFLATRRDAIRKAETFMLNWIRYNSGKDGTVEYSQFLNALKESGYMAHDFPSGFVGSIDDSGRLYTTEGKVIMGMPQGGTVIMNPDYDGEKDDGYVFRSKAPGALTQTWYYTLDYKAKSNVKKFEKVDLLDQEIDTMRKNWRKRLARIPKLYPSKEYLACMIMEVSWHTQGRIGNLTNQSVTGEEYKMTYGISTLKMEHIEEKGKDLIIEYRGKRNMLQRHLFKYDFGLHARNVISMISEWKKERGPEEFVFQTEEGYALTGAYVNRILTKMGAPDGVTIHKFRHLKGVRMMNKIVATHPFLKNPAKAVEVSRWLKEQAKSIGKVLGHFSMVGGTQKITGATAIAAYCPPNTMLKVYRDAKCVPPKSMLALVGIDTWSLEGYNFGDDPNL